MADIEVIFYDAEIVETDERIELPEPVASCDDVPTMSEAYSVMALMVYGGEHVAAAISIDGIFFLGCSINNAGVMRFIHTPAADAWFDEFYPGWRHGLAYPMFTN